MVDGATVNEVLEPLRGQQRSPVEALLELPEIEDETFAGALARRLGMSFVSDTELGEAAEGLHSRLPAKLALRFQLLPLPVEDGILPLATWDPFDFDARQAVGQELSREVRWVLGSRRGIRDGLKKGYGVGAEHWDEMLEGRETVDDQDDLKQEVNVLDNEDEEATVMSFVNQVFREALRERATDIHIEPLERDLRIRYRIDGQLLEVPVPPNMRLLQASLVSRLKIMAHLDIAERRLPQDGRINLELDGDPIDVRVATIPSVNGESVSLRLLTRQKFDFDRLGLEPAVASKIQELLRQPNGIILVTGPTGSGKSTTLYTFLRMLNTGDQRIVTIEDPVENKLDGVVQIAVKPEINLTFASGLRSILRGDPNVIMVGEMRDLETTEIAIRGALTGHLVFSTLHTNDAVGGISRLLDMGIEPFLISSSVRAFLAQRLVRQLCQVCSRPADLAPAYLDELGIPQECRGNIREAVGCKACRGSGFAGRMVIMEICPVSPQLQDEINQRATGGVLRKRALNDGMVSMRDDGWRKVGRGMTTIQEVLTATPSPDEIRDEPLPVID